MSAAHDCPGCGAPGVPQHQLACKPYWFRLPQDVRNAVNGSFRAKTTGQRFGSRSAAVTAHRRALAEALAWYRENRTPP